ncbi:hypothetical protein ACU8V3_07975 [Cobetia marina]
MNWLSHNPYFTYLHRQRLHILRVTVALTLCFSIIELFDLPHSSWALVSTVMVMGNLPTSAACSTRARSACSARCWGDSGG